MSLPEIEMPPRPPTPPPLEPPKSSHSLNYDDAEVKQPHIIDEVLESTKQTIEADPHSQSFLDWKKEQKEQMPPMPEESVVEEPVGGDDDLRIKPVIDDTDIFKDAKPKRKRKPPSEKQLAHLAKAREKATVVRKAKMEAKKKAKKKVAFDDVLQKTDPRPRREGPAHESLLLHLTRQELLDLQQQAIEGYDTKRKAQKKVKREAEEEVKKANLVNRRIAKAVGQPDPDDVWAQCFQ
jgi:hypothetical protein